MDQIDLPLTISYQTKGVTPIADVIIALQSAEIAIRDSVSLLPSLMEGVRIESSKINVQSLTQESPLREMFLVSLILAFQSDLESEIPQMIESLFQTEIPDSYDSVLTVVVMVVVFYGLAFAKDAATHLATGGPIKKQFEAMVAELASNTGRTEAEIRKILAAKFAKPNAAKRLAKAAQGLFIPSQREGAAAVTFDRKRVEPEVIRDIPYPDEVKDDQPFERFKSYSDVELEIHAQDRDKQATGWAAVPRGISDRRLKVKLMDPVSAADVWNRDMVKADVTIVSELTSSGFEPSEIHVTRIAD